MAKDNFFQEFTSIYTDKSINGWIRGVAWLGTAAAIYFVGDMVYKQVFPSAASKQAATMAANINNAISNEQDAGLPQTYPSANYDGYADTIYNDGNSWGHLGDSFSGIVDTLKQMQNDLDVSLLVKSFGTRKNEDLFAFVNSSFSAHWLGLVNPDKTSVNSDWSSKGITYQL
jgi:hypothetical protein